MTPQATTTPTTSTPSKPSVRYHGGTHYSVSSRTRAGHVHHVNTANLSCSCEAGRTGKRCWALALCVQYEAWRRHEEAKARAARPVPSVPASVPATSQSVPDFHQSAGYLALSAAFE